MPGNATTTRLKGCSRFTALGPNRYVQSSEVCEVTFETVLGQVGEMEKDNEQIARRRAGIGCLGIFSQLNR